VQIEYLTPRSTFYTVPAPGHSGRYRNPLVLANGAIVAAHTPDQGVDAELGLQVGDYFESNPRYDFRLRYVVDPEADGTYTAGAELTAGIGRTVWRWSPDARIRCSGPRGERSPVEVRARPEPPATSIGLAEPERQVFEAAEVDV